MPIVQSALDALLRPRSIAIVGVSRDTGRQTSINGSAVLESLLRFGYRGRIDLVHPQASEIGGRRAYPSIAALPDAPDLIVIALSAEQIPDAVEAAGARGIRAAVVMAAGFSELGEGAGTRLEEELRQAAARHGVRICGPNGLGYINVAAGVCAGYFPCLASVTPKAGGLGIITHSGAVGNSLLARAIDRGVGTSLVISAGNETNVGLADYVGDLVDDVQTRAISIYMEGVTDGPGLRKALERATAAGKQVVIYKVGKSPAGAKAALSHTAKVAGEPALYGGLFRQLGVVEATRLDDLIEIPMLFLKAAGSGERIPHNIGVVTISGGLGAIVADHFAAEGFALNELGKPTQARLSALPLKFGSVVNPVDTTAAIQRTEGTLADILAIVADDPGIDALVFPNASRFPQRALDLANLMADTAERMDKPLLSVWYAGTDNNPAMARLHASPRVACYDDPAAAARALAALRQSRGFAARGGAGVPAAPPGARVRAMQIAGADGVLSEPEGKAILAAYGIPVPREAIATTATEAAERAASIGFPVAMKIVSAAIPHKAALGGVRLNLASAAEVESAYQAMMRAVSRNAPAARLDGVLISEMVSIRCELIAGATVDPHLGPAFLVGMGGGEVERLRDVAMGLLPVTTGDCARMLGELADARVRLLDPGARDALVDAIARVAAMAHDLVGAMVELDVNPLVLAAGDRVLALDVMMNFAGAAEKAT